MSIPPLVCSTPPPPDQCEDDKDPDDFGLQYNLSQDDDECNDYYGHYSAYNLDISSTKTDDLKINSIKDEKTKSPIIESDSTLDSKTKFEEDVNIEDLNLKIDSVDAINDTIRDSTDNTIVDKSLCKENELPERLNEESTNSDDLTPTKDIVLVKEEPSIEEDESITEDDLITKNIEQNAVSDDINITSIPAVDIQNELENDNELTNNDSDDEFGDFDDFNSKESGVTSVLPDNYENPWESKDVTSDFGNFTANFSENAVQSQSSISNNESNFEFGDFAENVNNNIDKSDFSTETPESKTVEYLSEVAQKDSNANNENDDDDDYEDDDFGDFDDFKSSAPQDENILQSTQLGDPSQSVFNLNDSNIPVVDNINKVLCSIFEEEIVKPENETDIAIEAVLGETWGHLTETDVRQPYIVNWNNSFGQKTLLKALCIDSRNILFGHKWSHNMPKYAANLGVAPLQPQKSTSSTLPPNEVTPSEKPTSKNTSWVDPADGQQFTYAEALLLDLEHLMATLDQMAHNHSNLKISELLSNACKTENIRPTSEIRPTDLDVFETITTNSEKIYSSTINIQPIRQISLPDTHIFTPTDSEIPRSKTIHYDNQPSVLIPQLNKHEVLSEKRSELSIEQSSNHKSNEDDEDDYWEFQDFKSTPGVSCTPKDESQIPISDTSPPTLDNSVSKTVTYQTQILQPIKMDPIFPTLNWPDPGEVKEVFNDFTEFASSSSWNANQTLNKMDTNIFPPANEEKLSHVKQDDTSHVKQDDTKNSALVDNNIDDDFDTFQSAVPMHTSIPVYTNLNDNVKDTMANSGETVTFECDLKKINNNKLNVQSPYKSANSTNIESGFARGSKNVTDNIMPVNPNLNCTVLQPTPVFPSSINQQNSGQILQPLTLESFSQINWPNPGIDLQDLSRFNPVETLHSLKTDLSVNPNKNSPSHSNKSTVNSLAPEDDVWGEFVSSKPQVSIKKQTVVDDDEWSDFVSSPSIKPQNGLSTISLNVHTNLHLQKNTNKYNTRSNELDIPSLNYITPKTTSLKTHNDKHFQNL